MPNMSLKAVRIVANMDIDEWAKALNVSKYTIYNWEKGKTEPNMSQIKKMCELAKVDSDLLFLPKQS